MIAVIGARSEPAPDKGRNEAAEPRISAREEPDGGHCPGVFVSDSVICH